ncbi:MAG: discoidin domain-containing protein [Thermoanaerobaculia bacterium]
MIGRFAVRRLLGALTGLALFATGIHAAEASASAAGDSRTSGLLDAPAWISAPSDGVELAIVPAIDDRGQPALRLDYDFHGHAGWAAARRPLRFVLPPNYEIAFRFRFEGATNHLEVKLIDAGGENVWWNVRRDVEPTPAFAARRIARSALSFAWGPSSAPLVEISAIELAITASQGGRGSLWLSDFELRERPPVAPYAGTPTARASSETPGNAASRAIDGAPSTAWRTDEPRATLIVDFGRSRELGGLTLHWLLPPAALSVELSDDGLTFHEAGEEASAPRAGALRNDLRMPDTETRFLRLTVSRASGVAGIALAELDVRPLDFGATANDFVRRIAAESPRGSYPRAFTEGSLWTVVGVDGAAGDDEEALVSEDGVVEAGERSFSLEPFFDDGRSLQGWNESAEKRSLLDGDLPVPTIVRSIAGGELAITALASGDVGRSRTLVRYLLTASPERPLRGRLILAIRPFQVDPPQQFLNVAGGVSPIRSVVCPTAANAALILDGKRRLRTFPPADDCTVAAFAEPGIVEHWHRGGTKPGTPFSAAPSSLAVEDPQGLASGALEWTIDLAPGGRREIVVALPFAARSAENGALDPPDFDAAMAQERERWRGRLDRVRLLLPKSEEELGRAARSSLAYILVHRDGLAIQPGSRAYARSWIRDGALTGTALLRAGLADVAEGFAEWFSAHQFDDGKVPCCVDRRGADPVPENDSHGELIHLIAEVYRTTGDRAFAERQFPHVERAVDYLERLRQTRRTALFTRPEKQAFFGLLPESISHEGYSAKAMHSYWDDIWADVGFSDAAELAAGLDRPELAQQWRAQGAEFRADLLASIARVRAAHSIDYIPGCAELADFDATSTTIALDPGRLESLLPRAALEATFERYWRELSGRRSGAADWSGFTPYEMRQIGAFVRLGWRDRAADLVDYFLTVRQPPEWNQWPEVVRRDMRSMEFLGDLPHGWVASDFLRSLFDLFAYERRSDRTLVVAAGIPSRWLASGESVGVEGLVTAWGPLNFVLRRTGGMLHVEIGELARWPEGGITLLAPGTEAVRIERLPVKLDLPWKESQAWTGAPDARPGHASGDE